MTNQPTRCRYYQPESENVKPRYECRLPYSYINQNRNNKGAIPNNEEDCVVSNYKLRKILTVDTTEWAKKNGVIIREVSLFQRLICTHKKKNTIGTSETVQIREVSLFQRCLRDVYVFMIAVYIMYITAKKKEKKDVHEFALEEMHIKCITDTT